MVLDLLPGLCRAFCGGRTTPVLHLRCPDPARRPERSLREPRHGRRALLGAGRGGVRRGSDARARLRPVLDRTADPVRPPARRVRAHGDTGARDEDVVADGAGAGGRSARDRPSFIPELPYSFPYPSGHMLRSVILLRAVYLLWPNTFLRAAVLAILAGVAATWSPRGALGLRRHRWHPARGSWARVGVWRAISINCQPSAKS